MNTPIDSKNFAIGVLTTTAVILFVGLIIIATRPMPARADGMTTRGGEYVLTVGRGPITDQELLYVLDTTAQKLIAYTFNGSRREIEIVQGIDLAEVLQPSQPAQPRKPSRRRP